MGFPDNGPLKKPWVRVLVVLLLWPAILAWLLWRSPRFSTKSKALITGVAVVVVALGAVLSGGSGEPEKTEAAAKVQRGRAASSSPKATSSSSAATTPTTAAPDPDAARQSIADELQERVSKALAKSNRKASPRVTVSYPMEGGRVIVTWAINENLTEGLTKDTARSEAAKILEAISKVNPATTEVFLEGTYSLVDKLGNASEQTVIRAAYEPTTLRSIDFKNFYFKNVFEQPVVSSAFVHPAFRY